MRAKGMHPYRGIGVVSGLTLSTYMYFRSGLYANFFLTFVVIAIMGLELTRKRQPPGGLPRGHDGVRHRVRRVPGVAPGAAARTARCRCERPYELGASLRFPRVHGDVGVGHGRLRSRKPVRTPAALAARVAQQDVGGRVRRGRLLGAGGVHRFDHLCALPAPVPGRSRWGRCAR